MHGAYVQSDLHVKIIEIGYKESERVIKIDFRFKYIGLITNS